MEEIKFTVEKFFNENHGIVRDFIDAVKNGEVKNVYYFVDNVKKLRRGDYNFSFEMKGHKYVMDPEMSPYYALKIIKLFEETAFKFIHKKPEKLNRILERFKKGHCLGLEDQFDCCGYDVETYNFVESDNEDKYLDADHKYDYTNVDDEDATNYFVFTWYDDYSPSQQKSDDEIDEIIDKNGGLRFYVDYNDYDFEGCIKDLNRFTYDALKDLVEEQLEAIREIVTATYFKEDS